MIGFLGGFLLFSLLFLPSLLYFTNIFELFLVEKKKFIFSLKSEIICESESISNPVFTLVCDCLSGDGGFFLLFDSLLLFSFLFFVLYFCFPPSLLILCVFFSFFVLFSLFPFKNELNDEKNKSGEHCYVAGEQEKEILMGFSEVCEGESSFVKVSFSFFFFFLFFFLF